jgi:acetyltransferase-like isoleucine patch superfamily enzyme
METIPPVRKASPNRLNRALRLIVSVLDPRAWLHLFKIVNYYNYSHVAPLRQVNFDGPGNVSPDAVFQNPERITIGKRVRIGSRCHLWAGPGEGRILLGDDVLFGPDVLVTAATYRHDLGQPVTEQPMAEGDVTIGNDVWLATRAVVLPGTVIGDGSIVAAGAVVKGSFPPMSIIAGSPAKVVSKRMIAGLTGPVDQVAQPQSAFDA